MANEKPKALVVLTMQRSGSNYFTSRTNHCGKMGHAREWLDRSLNNQFASIEESLEFIKREGTTSEGVFGLVLMAPQLIRFQKRFKIDFMNYLTKTYDPTFVLLERRDKLAQAISFSKAIQSRSWAGDMPAERPVSFNYRQIVWALFHLEKGMGFWRSYLTAKALPYYHCYYEDISSQDTAFEEIAQLICPKKNIEFPESNLVVQRDQVSQEWTRRFLEKSKDDNFLPMLNVNAQSRIKRSVKNLYNFLRRKPIQIRKSYF